VLAQLTAAEAKLEIRTGRTVSSGAVALCTQYWTRRSRDLSRERFGDSRSAKLVLVRGGEGLADRDRLALGVGAGSLAPRLSAAE
jgi:hypothetical protein